MIYKSRPQALNRNLRLMLANNETRLKLMHAHCLFSGLPKNSDYKEMAAAVLLQLPHANQHKQNLVMTRAPEKRCRCLLQHSHKTADFHYPVKKVCVSLGTCLCPVKLNAPTNVAMHDSNE